LFEATTAQDDVDIEAVVARRDHWAQQKEAAYGVVEERTRDLHHAWRVIFAIHRKEEEDQQALPRAGSSLTALPSDNELADNIAGRMPAGYGAIVRDACQGVLPINWAAVRDVDVGLKSLEETSVGRVCAVAEAWRLKMAQQVEQARDEEERE
jgi:hypothetical protein